MSKRTKVGILVVLIAVACLAMTSDNHTIDFYPDGDDTIDMGDGSNYIKGGSGSDDINLEGGTDYIRMNNDDDWIIMGAGDDEISLGSGNDKIVFYGGYGGGSETNQIVFDDNDTTYIKHTSSDDNLEIKSGAGDVIITLGS